MLIRVVMVIYLNWMEWVGLMVDGGCLNAVGMRFLKLCRLSLGFE